MYFVNHETKLVLKKTSSTEEEIKEFKMEKVDLLKVYFLKKKGYFLRNSQWPIVTPQSGNNYENVIIQPEKAELVNCTFTNCLFMGFPQSTFWTRGSIKNMTNCTLNECAFNTVDLVHSITECTFNECTFKTVVVKATLWSSKFEKCLFKDTIFECTLDYTSFRDNKNSPVFNLCLCTGGGHKEFGLKVFSYSYKNTYWHQISLI